MQSSITEVLAAILILLSLIKLTAVSVNARKWIGFAKRIYVNPKLTSFVALAAAAAILYLLVRSGLDIVQILAVCLFVVALTMAGMAPYAPRLLAWLETEDVNQLIKSQWLYISAWIALLVWGASTLLT